MIAPTCRPLMDGASPNCRCLQCDTARLLRPHFPSMSALQLSPDRARVVLVTPGEGGWEVWTGAREPLQLVRAWGTAAELGNPVFSPDGREICIPTRGDPAGLWLLPRLGPPRRLTHGHDVDPRWTARGVAFYRLSEDGMQLMSVDVGGQALEEAA